MRQRVVHFATYLNSLNINSFGGTFLVYLIDDINDISVINE